MRDTEGLQADGGHAGDDRPAGCGAQRRDNTPPPGGLSFGNARRHIHPLSLIIALLRLLHLLLSSILYFVG